MKITILNGNPTPSPLDGYLARLQTALEAQGDGVTRLDLREMNLRPCTGCWGCWIKTPGVCVSRDASMEIDRAVINADFVLLAAPLKLGFPSALLKMALDKHLPLIHPYILMDQGEMHHRKRYDHYPRMGLVVEREPSSDADDLQIVESIFCRTALNFKSRLEFCLTTEMETGEIARRVSGATAPLPLPARLGPVPGASIHPPQRLTLFNGSPRGKRGSTPILLREFAKGFGDQTTMHHLMYLKQMEQLGQAFAQAECAWIGFPLYTDAMPATVKLFFEALEPLVGRPDNPPLGFLVQSGFPEGLHSRYIERYLEKLAARLGSPYLGTIVKGNGEGVRSQPAEATKDLFANLQTLGAGLARDGRLDAQVLARLAIPEAFPGWMEPVMQLVLRLPASQSYFARMLKANGVYQQRFARPFVELR